MSRVKGLRVDPRGYEAVIGPIAREHGHEPTRQAITAAVEYQHAEYPRKTINPTFLGNLVAERMPAPTHRGTDMLGQLSEAERRSQEHLHGFLGDAMREWSNAYEDGNYPIMALNLVSYGYVIAGEYLHDEQEMDGPRARSFLLDVLARFMAKAMDKARAESFLADAWKATEKNSAFASSIWGDWRVELAGLLEEAKVGIDEYRTE